MMDCTLLNRKSTYRIMGKPEVYHFSHCEGEFRKKRYVFWRISKTNPNKRVNVSLNQEQTQRQVWEEITNDEATAPTAK